MHPEIQLAVLTGLAGFLLKTSLGFCVCWLIGKAVAQPRHKFLVWFGYLFVAACYWLWLLASLLPLKLLPGPVQMPTPLPVSATVGTLHLQPFWQSPLSILLRGLACLYAVSLLSFLYLRVKKHLQLHWVLQFTYAPPEATEKIFSTIADNLRVRDVRLLMLSGVYSPATFGWVKPVILLPPLCLEQDEGELRDILRHELQHIRRRDSLFSALASLSRALLFFHPAVWYALRRLKLESELACDLAVVGDSPERRATYAECLVRFAKLRLAQETAPWNLDFAGSPVQLKVRIGSMLAGNRSVPGWMLGLRITSGMLLLAGFVAVSPSLFVALSYQQPSADQPAATPLQPVLQQHPVRNRVSRRSAARTHAVPDTSTPAADSQPSIPVQTAVNTPLVAPAKSRISTSSDLMLKRRGDPVAPKTPAPSKIILLSNPSAADSAHSVARGASVVSAITAGARGALQVASHGRDKESH